MEFFNLLSERRRLGSWQTQSYHQALKTFLILLAPSAPYIAEELWHLTGNTNSVHTQDWPEWDADQIKEVMVTIVVQIDGKVRDSVEILPEMSESEIQDLVMKRPKVRQHLAERQVKKTIYVPEKILSIVTL